MTFGQPIGSVAVRASRRSSAEGEGRYSQNGSRMRDSLVKVVRL